MLAAVCLQGEWAAWCGEPAGMDTDAGLLCFARGRSSGRLKSASFPSKHKKLGHLLLGCLKITLSLHYLSNYFNPLLSPAHTPPPLTCSFFSSHSQCAPGGGWDGGKMKEGMEGAATERFHLRSAGLLNHRGTR